MSSHDARRTGPTARERERESESESHRLPNRSGSDVWALFERHGMTGRLPYIFRAQKCKARLTLCRECILRFGIRSQVRSPPAMDPLPD